LDLESELKKKREWNGIDILEPRRSHDNITEETKSTFVDFNSNKQFFWFYYQWTSSSFVLGYPLRLIRSTIWLFIWQLDPGMSRTRMRSTRYKLIQFEIQLEFDMNSFFGLSLARLKFINNSVQLVKFNSLNQITWF
jgi:hypothetical protein